MLRRPVCALSLVCSLVLASVFLNNKPVQVRAAMPPTGLPPSQQTGVRMAEDGTLTLVEDAAPLPVAASGFHSFGFFISQPLLLSSPTNQVSFGYRASAPAGSLAALDLRGSGDGVAWTAWQTELQAGAVVRFERTVRFVQYRARLFGSGAVSPSVAQVSVAAQALAPQNSPSGDGPVAPTWKLRATRMGMVGGRTANGHIIKPRDHFVSLPSWRSLCSKGGREYLVRITYKGRSSVAPVYDVGPWNTRDNYWDVERERYRDLPHGWPQDHAAYYDKYNGGYAEKGYVRFPTAIDIGDGVWWDDLGINGDQAEVEVTFLWLGRDPQGEPPPPPASPTPEATATPDVPPTPSATPTPRVQDGQSIGEEPAATTPTPSAQAPAAEPSEAPGTPASPEPGAPTAEPSREPELPASPEPGAPTVEPSEEPGAPTAEPSREPELPASPEPSEEPGAPTAEPSREPELPASPEPSAEPVTPTPET